MGQNGPQHTKMRHNRSTQQIQNDTRNIQSIYTNAQTIQIPHYSTNTIPKNGTYKGKSPQTN
jgi:hypothetical protein